MFVGRRPLTAVDAEKRQMCDTFNGAVDPVIEMFPPSRDAEPDGIARGIQPNSRAGVPQLDGVRRR